jgi:hypothetical protein
VALVNCPDCDREISDAAPACVGCGRPMTAPVTGAVSPAGPVCRHCGSDRVGKSRGLQGISELAIFLILFVLGVIPGIVYYIWQESVPYCAGCGRRT